MVLAAANFFRIFVFMAYGASGLLFEFGASGLIFEFGAIGSIFELRSKRFNTRIRS